MTDLTEQYLNGNLPDGDEYYIENKDGEISTMHLYNDTIHWHSFKVKKLKVLAPVPTYSEYLALQSDNLAKNDGEEINAELEAENTKLKELLKENKRLTDILYNISYQTPALGGNKKAMERALLDIDYLCDLALRPDEIKELEK